jgi:alpha-L-fucosidase 2
MKIILFAFAMLIACVRVPARAQALPTECPPIKIRNPEGNYIIPGAMGHIVYRRVNGIELSLDAYVQKRGGNRPAVVVIHGGGFDTGSRVAFVGQFLELLTRAGYNWFSIDYRLNDSRKPEEAMEDAQAALDFIRCHAREFRIDPNRIALLGEDSGALLAASTSARAAILIGGRYDSSVATKPGTPATLVVHGTNDREVPPQQAETYGAGIRARGGRCDYLPVEGAIHRAENWPPHQWSYKEKLLAWLGQELNHKRADHEAYATNLKKQITFDPKQNLRLDAYQPKGRGPHPAVIIAHGGGWEAGDRVTYITPILEPLARAGFAWFSIDYRLTPRFRHPDQLEDLRQAIRFVRANARRFRVDPRRIAILGESASGQMAAQLATEEATEAAIDVAAVVSFYGVYDFEPMARDLSPRSIPTRLFGIEKLDEASRATLRRYSPLHNIRSGMPPMLLLCGTKDGLYAQQQAFAAALDRAGVPYETFIVEGAPHGMENWEGHPAWMEYKTKLVDWLKIKLATQTGS